DRQTAAEPECVVPGFLFPRARRSLQRLVGDFVAEDLFINLVESGGVAHGFGSFRSPAAPAVSRQSAGSQRNSDTTPRPAMIKSSAIKGVKSNLNRALRVTPHRTVNATDGLFMQINRPISSIFEPQDRLRHSPLRRPGFPLLFGT